MDKRIARRRQERLKRKFACILTMNLTIVLVIMAMTTFLGASEKNKIEDEIETVVYESEEDHNTTTSSANTSYDVAIIVEEETEAETEVQAFSRGLTDEEKLLLAKIAMAEAEGESLDTKILVIMTVLNRVEAKGFPDTIEEVIFQNKNGTYQFSPTKPNGRWWTTEPNSECWEAVEIVNMTEEDVSNGALYFEACKGESWHSRNLHLICQSDKTRFYK